MKKMSTGFFNKPIRPFFSKKKYSLLLMIAAYSASNVTAQTNQFNCRLITLDPAHFHAALVQKTAYPQVDKNVYVYAPANDAALKAHLNLVEGYNNRANTPTAWNEVVYTGTDYFEKMLQEKKGNVVVLAGNNRLKTTYIKKSVEAGLNVFADKPMAITSEGFSQLKEAFATARQKHVSIFDIMTERYQVTNALQKELAQIPAVFGSLKNGSTESPAVEIESVHHFLKTVSGKPLLRPTWYFDVNQQGEGIADVTTHLVDLVQWECFPNTNLNYAEDIKITAAKRWPTILTAAQYSKVTSAAAYPEFLLKDVKDSLLSVYANGEINYTLKGVHVKITAIWNYEAPPGGGDTHYSIVKGTKANLIVKQGADQHFTPELYVEPVASGEAYYSQLKQAINTLAEKYPGLSLAPVANGWQVIIPATYRLDHEATFSEVTKKFLHYLQVGNIPVWETKAMLAKYYTTTQALKVAISAKNN